MPLFTISLILHPAQYNSQNKYYQIDGIIWFQKDARLNEMEVFLKDSEMALLPRGCATSVNIDAL